MDIQEKTVTLPPAEEIVKRLKKVSDEPHMASGLYPLIARDGGTNKVPFGIVMLLSLSIHDYTDGMPPVMARLVHNYVPQFIDAIVDDKEVAEAAKAHHQEAVDKARRKA